MGHTVGDGLIVAALAAALVAYFYFKHAGRRQRLEIVHQERLVAMDKGIPLPELPLDVPQSSAGPNPLSPLLHGVVWLALGLGAIATLLVVPLAGAPGGVWALPLPLVFLGVGLVLYYIVASRQAR